MVRCLASNLPTFQPLTEERERRIERFLVSGVLIGEVKFTSHIGFRKTTLDTRFLEVFSRGKEVFSNGEHLYSND